VVKTVRFKKSIDSSSVSDLLLSGFLPKFSIIDCLPDSFWLGGITGLPYILYFSKPLLLRLASLIASR